MGIWAVLHEVRSEYAQLLTVLFLATNGPGIWSLDALWRGASERQAAPTVEAKPRPLPVERPPLARAQ